MPGGYVEYNGKVYETSNVESFLEDNPGATIYLGDLPSTETKPGKTTTTEAIGLGAAQGASAGLAEEVEGGINYLLTKAGVYPERGARRGLDAPAAGIGEHVEAARKKYTKAAEDRPVAYYAGDIAAGIPMGAAIPGASLGKAKDALKAKRGLEALKAAGKGLAPMVGAGAAEGAFRTEGGVGERAKGAGIGAGLTAAVPPALKALISKPVGRAALGAGAGYLASEGAETLIPGEGDYTDFSVAIGGLLGLKPNVVLKAYSRIKGAGKTPTVKKALDDFLSATPEGVARRQQARAGDEAAQEAVDEISRRLNSQLSLEDTVKEYANTGMKPEYIDQVMAVDFVETIAKPEMAKTAAIPKGAYRPPERLRRKEQVQGQWATPSSLQKIKYNDLSPMQLRNVSGLTLDEVNDLLKQGVSKEDIVTIHGKTMQSPVDVQSATSPASPIGKKKKAAGEDYDELVSGSRRFQQTGIKEASREMFEQHQLLAKESLRNAYNEVHAMADEASKLADDLLNAKLSVGKKIKNDVNQLKARFKIEDIDNMTVGSHDKAEAFIAVDQLKRRIWSVAELMERSKDSNAGHFALESWKTGTVLQLNLEDPKKWGSGAANLQIEVNRAWHPYLTVRKPAQGEKGFGKLFLTHAGAEPSAHIGRTKPESDPRKIERFVSDLGKYEDDPLERSFLKGIRTSTDLARMLSKHYGGDPKLMGMAEKMGAEQRAMEALLEETKGKLGARRRLQDVEKASGSERFFDVRPTTVVRGMTALEDLARTPGMRRLGRRAGELRKTITTTPGTVGASMDIAEQMWGDRPVSEVTSKQEEFEVDPRLEAAKRVESFRKNTTNPSINKY